ncbi:MAG: tetratricopeptide repeat protein [Proteobacteria bacterium]|nr:tetratricopeptide repeat protein [Pseudomonadota bacterium]
MAVTLPVVLLILDFFPLKRSRSKIQVIIIEKIPFYLLGVLFCAITIWSQNLDGAIKTLESSPLSIRIFVAVRAYVIYFEKFLFPFNLTPIYPYPLSTTSLASIDFVIPALILMLFFYMIIRSFKKKPVLSVLGLYYIITLLPVIGIIKVGDQALADRYSYLASLAPTLLCGLVISNTLIFYGNRIYRKTTLTLLILIVFFLSINTIKQLSIWQDSIALWSHETKLYPDSISRAYLKLGLAYDDSDNSKMAIKSYSKAIEINPQYRDALNNRAVAYTGEGKYLMAIQDLDKALKLDSNDAISYSSRGNAYFRLGDMKKAINNYSKAISVAPQFVDAYNNRGFVNYTLKNMAQARFDFHKAIALDSNYSEGYYTLALIDLQDGATQRAVSNLKKAAQLGNREAQIYLQKNKTILGIK